MKIPDKILKKETCGLNMNKKTKHNLIFSYWDVRSMLFDCLKEVEKIIDEWLNEYCSHGKAVCGECITELKQKLKGD